MLSYGCILNSNDGDNRVYNQPMPQAFISTDVYPGKGRWNEAALAYGGTGAAIFPSNATCTSDDLYSYLPPDTSDTSLIHLIPLKPVLIRLIL